MYSLQDIALGGAALTAVSSWLTQVLKQLIELKWGPQDPAHDPLVHVASVAASVLCVEVATLAGVSAAAFTPAWWQALVTGAGLGLGVKISAQGAYALLTSGKVDALPALATEVLQTFIPAPVTASSSAGTVTVSAPVTPASAPLVDAAAIADQITAAVVAALTPAAFNPPPSTSPLIIPPSTVPVPGEAATS